MPDKHLKPNILITGTPGTGKTTLGRQLAEETGFEFISVGEVAAENDYFDGFDDQLDTHVLNDEAVLDHLEDRLNGEQGGCIVEYHGCDFFPERWFDVVFVLRTNNTALYDRLTARGYSKVKLDNNVQAEIFGTILEEAVESYEQDIVHQLQNDTPDDEERNVGQIKEWMTLWIQQHS